MQLTGLILFIGGIILFLLWGRDFYYFLKYKTLLHGSKKELLIKQIKGIVIFIVIAISAGMAWG